MDSHRIPKVKLRYHPWAILRRRGLKMHRADRNRPQGIKLGWRMMINYVL